MVLQRSRRRRDVLIPTTASQVRTMLPLGISRHVNRRHHPRRCRILQADSELFEGGQPGDGFDNRTKDNTVGGDAGQLLLQEGHAAQLPTCTAVFENGERRTICYEECSEEWTTKLV